MSRPTKLNVRLAGPTGRKMNVPSPGMYVPPVPSNRSTKTNNSPAIDTVSSTLTCRKLKNVSPSVSKPLSEWGGFRRASPCARARGATRTKTSKAPTTATKPRAFANRNRLPHEGRNILPSSTGAPTALHVFNTLGEGVPGAAERSCAPLASPRPDEGPERPPGVRPDGHVPAAPSRLPPPVPQVPGGGATDARGSGEPRGPPRGEPAGPAEEPEAGGVQPRREHAPDLPDSGPTDRGVCVLQDADGRRPANRGDD